MGETSFKFNGNVIEKDVKSYAITTGPFLIKNKEVADNLINQLNNKLGYRENIWHINRTMSDICSQVTIDNKYGEQGYIVRFSRKIKGDEYDVDEIIQEEGELVIAIAKANARNSIRYKDNKGSSYTVPIELLDELSIYDTFNLSIKVVEQ